MEHCQAALRWLLSRRLQLSAVVSLWIIVTYHPTEVLIN